MDKDMNNFFPLAGMEFKGIEEVSLDNIKIPDYIKHTMPSWSKKFQKEIAKAEKKGLIKTLPQFTVFCLKFAKKHIYKDNPEVLKVIKRLEKEFAKSNKKESFEHKLGKAKAVFWLLDSGFNPEWIEIESEIIQGHRADIGINIPLKGLWNPNFPINKVLLLKIAIEIGNWHKFPNYLEYGIPIVWSPFKTLPLEKVQRFINKQKEKYNFDVYPIRHYVHILDSTFTALVLIPKGGINR